MKNNDFLDNLDRIIAGLDAHYPDVAAMNVEIVYQTENGDDSYLSDTVSLYENGHFEILKAMQKIEIDENKNYRVLTRNSTRLGEMYHCETIADLDFNGFKVLELQWG